MAHNPDKVEASSGYNHLQDVTAPEKSTGMQASGVTPYVSLYQMKGESVSDDKNEDYMKPFSYLPELPPKKKK